MLKRGHHIRCFPGKATERFLITPHRGAEFIDLVGDEHMVCDWLRGACSLGNMPANGLFYVTPDPCSCYAGARIYGFNALAAGLPAGLDSAPPPDSPGRLVRAGRVLPGQVRNPQSKTPAIRCLAHVPPRCAPHRPRGLRALRPRWRPRGRGNSGERSRKRRLPAVRVLVVRRDTYELVCLNLADGQTVWKRAFAAALDGPPTIVGERLFLGCRDGSVFSLNAADGAVAWRFLAAPLEALTLDNGRLEGLWPVSSSVLFAQRPDLRRGRPQQLPRRRHPSLRARPGHRRGPASPAISTDRDPARKACEPPW